MTFYKYRVFDYGDIGMEGHTTQYSTNLRNPLVEVLRPDESFRRFFYFLTIISRIHSPQ
jgi:hypothetical protein